MSEITIELQRAGLDPRQNLSAALRALERAGAPLATAAAPASCRVDLAALVRRYLGQLVADGVEDPLAQRLLLGCVVADLFDLAGVAAPPGVARLIS